MPNVGSRSFQLANAPRGTRSNSPRVRTRSDRASSYCAPTAAGAPTWNKSSVSGIRALTNWPALVLTSVSPKEGQRRSAMTVTCGCSGVLIAFIGCLGTRRLGSPIAPRHLRTRLWAGEQFSPARRASRLDGVVLQHAQGDDGQGLLVGGFQHHLRGCAGVQRLLPARRAEAPAVAG